jgi:branched-chain amino acid transport system permease protein
VLQVVTPGGVFGTLVSAQALILSLFGGVGTLWGPLIGASVLVPLTEALRAQLGHILPGIQGVIYGLTIMIVILVAPEGVFWRIRDMIMRRRGRVEAEVGPAEEPSSARPIRPRPIQAHTGSTGEVVLSVNDLSKSFGGLKAVQNVSFDVRRGEIVGIIGPNGAGKTTLFNLLNGFQKPTAGTVHVLGEDVVGLLPNAICRRGIGRTFQVARPFLRMSVLNNVVVGALANSGSGGEAIAAAREALMLVGLGDHAEAAVATLTNLELRLLELARALATKPHLILLDETLAGLGAGEVEEIIPVIRRLSGAGVTIVIIEHTMHAMMRLADRFVVLDHGQVIAQGAPRHVMAERAVVEAYLGKKWAEAHAYA